MVSSLQVTEDASAAVAVAPRITKEFIEGQIARKMVCRGDGLVSAAEAPEEWQPLYTHHTICVLTTRAGFTVIGHSAPASPENFNAALGEQFAYENAFRQLWPMFAFAMLEATALGIDLTEYQEG